MDFLQLTLMGNALFSLTTGLGLVIFYKTICQWFGRQRSTPFWIMGIGLIAFASYLFLIMQNPEPQKVWYIIILDVVWVIGSIAILFFKPFGLSPKGLKIIAGIALIVALLAIGQFFGMC